MDNSVAAHWLGCIVPKRQARRAVTRNLLKRQMRECFQQRAAGLPHGLWVLRLHAGFGVADYPSARSEALATVARAEIHRLLDRLLERGSAAVQDGAPKASSPC